ncbi:MAG: hypothetical protein J0L88_11600 [Xanthomonadales bacterium]|nr:hypothetical protein [Xanthomonadales bacterium]
MNAPAAVQTAWYRVPEVWLIFVLLGATILGTFVMMAMATRQPDTHLVVPNDVPRPSKIPPITPAATAPARGHGAD